MKTITHNKLRNKALCYRCKKNEVPLERWNRPCDECKKAANESVEKETIIKGQPQRLATRTPAAIIQGPNGEEIFVDKLGRPMNNPGYDTQNDPRGKDYTGKAPKEKMLIM